MTETKTKTNTRTEPLFVVPKPDELEHKPFERGMAYIFRQGHQSEREIGAGDLHHTFFLLGRADEFEMVSNGTLAIMGTEEEADPILKRLDFCKAARAPMALSAVDLADGKVGLFARFVDLADVAGYIFNFGFGEHVVVSEAIDGN